MAEENVFTYDWGTAPPAAGGGDFYGDWFQPGPRYRFKVTDLKERKDKETGKLNIDLVAVCIPGGNSGNEGVGQVLKHSFGFPLKSEVADPKKNFGAQFCHLWMIACGAPEQKGVAGVPLDKFIGRQFEATTRSYVKAAQTKMVKDVDGNDVPKTYEARKTSFLDQVYEVKKDATGAAAQSETASASKPADKTTVSASEAEATFEFAK